VDESFPGGLNVGNREPRGKVCDVLFYLNLPLTRSLRRLLQRLG
jgi:hypothetical protein